ncbi:MAG: MgtC/SapB family protein [Candidatus Paceibacterota bacterium]|jgi:putative Mg2+ transporter-C (MgtC) family protein
MFTFEQMLTRLIIALALGILIGLEREFAGKEAGIRTSMLVSAGAAIFTMIGLSLPYIIGTSPENINEIISKNGGFLNIIANIVVGIGFIGAGIIVKVKEHIHGLTTAANIWMTAAIGILVGLGLLSFAIAAAIIISGLLFLLRKIRISEKIDHDFPGKDDDRN